MVLSLSTRQGSEKTANGNVENREFARLADAADCLNEASSYPESLRHLSVGTGKRREFLKLRRECTLIQRLRHWFASVTDSLCESRTSVLRNLARSEWHGKLRLRPEFGSFPAMASCAVVGIRRACPASKLDLWVRRFAMAANSANSADNPRGFCVRDVAASYGRSVNAFYGQKARLFLIQRRRIRHDDSGKRN